MEKKSKRFFWLGIFGVMIILWVYLQNGSDAASDVVGKQAGDFTLKDEKGNTVHLADYKGQVVLLHFWASWCNPCVVEFPTLNNLYHAMEGKPFVILAVSMDEGGKKDIDAFRKNVKFDFNAVLNPDQTVADLYGTFRLPESFIIDKNGKVARKIVGPQDWTNPEWIKVFAQYF